MRSKKVILMIEVKDWILRHVSMAKSHCSIFCTWTLFADLPFNVLQRKRDGCKTPGAGYSISLSCSLKLPTYEWL